MIDLTTFNMLMILYDSFGAVYDTDMHNFLADDTIDDVDEE